MTAQRRFRVRKKLQAAMLRLIEVLGEMQEYEVAPNKENVATVAMAMTVLDAVLSGIGLGKAITVTGAGKRAVLSAARKRVKETQKRRGRRGYKALKLIRKSAPAGWRTANSKPAGPLG